MAVTVLSNKKNLAATIHVTPANATLIVAGNSSVSNVATSDEILTAVSIKNVAWGTDAGSIQLLRGSNVVGIYTGSGNIDYLQHGALLTKDNAANLVVNFSGTANAYLMFEVQKVGTFTSDYMVR